MKIFSIKNLLKLIWIGFGVFGLAMVSKQYFPDIWPKMQNSQLVKGVTGEMVETVSEKSDGSDDSIKFDLDFNDLKNMDPQQASQVVAKEISEQITEIIRQTTTEIKEFPAKQIKKVKIGACEELLEEDICSVAVELDCPVPND